MGLFDKQIRETLKKGANAVVDKAIDHTLNGKDKARNANVRENPLVTKLTESLDNFGLTEEEKRAKEEAKIAQEEAERKAKEESATAPRTVKDDINDALDRLAVIAESLEESDKHQFIRDVNVLTENSPRFRKERPEWTLRLYGNKKA